MKIIDFLSTRLPLLIFLMAIGTYISPVYWKVSTWVPSLLLGFVIFLAGLSMDIEAIRDIRNRKRSLFIATFLKWTFTVIVSIVLAIMFFSSHPEIAAGLILSGTVPSGTAGTVYTFLAGGTTSLVIVASLIDVIISPIITPLSMLVISSEQITISFFSLLKSFLLIVALPIGLGLFIQRVAPQAKTYSKMTTKLGSAVSILLIVHTIVGSGKDAISLQIALLPLIAFATFVQVLLPMVGSYFIAKKLGVCEEDARATLYQVGLCNTALAAILAFQFIGELGTIAPILNMVFNLSMGSYISNYFSKRKELLVNEGTRMTS